ncbi:ATP-binding protein [Mucilaginibacter roseus]|uniref:ATP-binding protein n=1 Tax=Mucilaginibacter roseus TaxID=1528868 RepID=A0ABS8TZ02_9SPHI|nr:ATP-binding protein [Mucilaginibacter roseus]MCD8739050.1 ATP-binding protein [Mucilaginibacter roseus]
MRNHFSPSVNILTQELDLSQYFLTTNVQDVYDMLRNNYRSGQRAINLIGAYGTGKSSFLSAVMQHLSGERLFYEAKPWVDTKSFHFLKAVSEYDSFIGQFAGLIGSTSDRPQQLLKDFIALLRSANKQNEVVVLIFDEFGKILEYAAKHEPEKELYFIQQLAELVNSGDAEVLLLTTLHQDFAGYAQQLSKLQRNEWVKVKGRFKEITFNEPVEQLLYLASQRLNSAVPVAVTTAFEKVFQAIVEAKVYPLRDFFNAEVAAKLYPLDILAAAVLAQALQRYGQNERSLFSFLNGDNYFDLTDFESGKANFYGLNAVYDYLNYNLNSFLQSKANPDYTYWAEIRNALERVDGEFDFTRQATYQAAVKTIGMMQVFLPGSARIDREFLATYLDGILNTKDGDATIGDLQQRCIIRYYKRTARYTLYEASDVDIDVAISSAAAEVSRANDVVKYLSTYFNFPTVSAKRAYFERGTPRVFEFKISDNPYISQLPQGEIDGFVNLLFSDLLTEADMIRISGERREPILYGHYQNTAEIKELIEEIEKAEIAREKHKSDRIAKKELDAIIDRQRNLLNHYVMNSFYNPAIVRWFYRGEEDLTITNGRRFNAKLSEICADVYADTPIFRSELANKTKLSPSISTARRELFQALFNHEGAEDLNIKGSPPQKSIYYSLLRQTGIHALTDGHWLLQQPGLQLDPFQFGPLFASCDQFLETSRGIKRSVSDLYGQLSKAPFKLKKGFLDFWVPIYLILKRSDYALYGEFGYITDLNAEILELLVKKPGDYAVKAFDVAGIRINMFNRYREMLQLPQKERTDNEAFVQTIVPFIRFYKELNSYAQHTRRISTSSQKIRKALTNAEDPERLFFEDFPSALGFDLVQLNKEPALLAEFTEALQHAIRELRSAYEQLLTRFELAICSLWDSELSFGEYKARIRARYENGLKEYLLLPYQRTFYNRLLSPLDDRKAWLSSVAQSIINKPLEQSNDEDELRLFNRFPELIHELDNLNDIGKKEGQSELEETFKIEITVPGTAVRQQVVTMPKKQSRKFSAAQEGIATVLEGENRFTKIAILAEMLKKELAKDG